MSRRNDPGEYPGLAKFQNDIMLEGTRRYYELMIQDLDIQILRVDRLLELWRETRQETLVDMRRRLIELRRMCQEEQDAADREIYRPSN